MARVTVLCCAENTDAAWRWIEPYFSSTDVHFVFARCPPLRFDQTFRVLNLRRLLGCLAAVRMARTSDARIIVTHGPTLAAWCAIFSRLLGLRVPIIAHSFNF